MRTCCVARNSTQRYVVTQMGRASREEGDICVGIADSLCWQQELIQHCIKTCILSRVKQINSPGWMLETSAWGWCTGKTQRDRVEREVGGGVGMGNTCKSMADSCQCMANPLQYCKVSSLQLIKINGKKLKKNLKS